MKAIFKSFEDDSNTMNVTLENGITYEGVLMSQTLDIMAAHLDITTVEFGTSGDFETEWTNNASREEFIDLVTSTGFESFDEDYNFEQEV